LDIGGGHGDQGRAIIGDGRVGKKRKLGKKKKVPRKKELWDRTGKKLEINRRSSRGLAQ